MRHPLNENTARRGKTIQFPADGAQVRGRESAEFPMDGNALGLNWTIAAVGALKAGGTPDVNFVSLTGQSRRQLAGIVADST